MNNTFDDITDKLGEPKWYDDKGVPRYKKFHPSVVSNIYAKKVAFLEIACQACGEKFKVAVHYGNNNIYKEFELPSAKGIKSFHYGDPPVHGCVGDTMNVDTVKILEFWQKAENLNWKRNKKIEDSFNLARKFEEDSFDMGSKNG